MLAQFSFFSSFIFNRSSLEGGRRVRTMLNIPRKVSVWREV